MYKIIEQKEVNEICRLLSECAILPVSALKCLLKKRGKTDTQINCIINQIVKNKRGYFDESKNYIRISKAITTKDINKGIVKSFWVLTDLLESIGDYFFQYNAPHTLTFHNIKNQTDNPFYDVFYIPCGGEKLSSFNINNYFENGTEINGFIIIDNKEQIDELNSLLKINIVNYITVKSDGTIEYIEKE